MSDRETRLSRAILWLCGVAGALSVTGVLGNVFDLHWLMSVVPGRPTMRLTTALLLALCAACIVLERARHARRVKLAAARALGVAVCLHATLILVEYVYGIDLGIDWRLPSVHSRGPHLGRASPFTALALAALGAAISLHGLKARWAAAVREGLCLIALFVAFTSLIGHAFGAGPLYEFQGSHVIGVALPTGVALTALGIAAWISQPEFGLLRLAAAPGPGGQLLRRLGAAAVLGGPLLVGVFLLFVKVVGLSDLSLILAIGSVLGVVCAVCLLAATAMPIERSAAQSEQNRTRTQQLLEQAPLGVFVADLTGRYTDVNTAGCKLLGYTRDEILAKTITDLIPESDAARLWSIRDRMLDGSTHVDEWRLLRRDGTFTEVEVTAKVHPDGRWQAFVADISERLELERRLIESRDFLERVLESSTEYAIVVEDLGRHIVLWNEGARRCYGYEADEVRGQSSDILVATAEEPEWTALHARGLEQGKATGNLLARRRDGTPFNAHVVCTRRLGPNDATAGVLLVMRDLTQEQRHLADQEFLSRVGVELAACLDYRETLARVIQLATSFLGDLATIDVAQDSVLRRAMSLGRADSRDLARAVEGLGSAFSTGHPIATVLETKQPLLLATIGVEERKRFASSPEHLRVIEAVNATSAMLVPLIARDQLLAVLSIAARDGARTYGPDDLRLAMELARRAALTLDNVQLLQQSRLQAAVTTNLAEAVIVVRAEDAGIVYANPRTETMFGIAAHELLGLPMAALLAPSAMQPMRERIAEALDRASEWHGELECVRRDGTRFWCSISVSNFDHAQHGRVWIALYTDISERKRALHEKEVLLREIHHRVKNNLQVISSLFSLQRERTNSPELRALLDESCTRVASIALVHDQLYRAADLAAIDFDEYLHNLTEAIRSSYGADAIRMRVNARGVLLEIDQAVPCALLVCELVSNSLRHAFGDAAGEVWVRAERDAAGFCLLEVGDDGRGLAADFDLSKARSLGLKLVYNLARQLRASISVERTNGTCFKLRFPPRHAKAAATHPRVAAS